jgi:predicted hydrocarbon binding protein
MRNKLTHKGATCSKFEAELVFNYLKNFFATLGLADIEEAVETLFDTKKLQVKETTTTEENTQEKVFNYLGNRGLIINPSDGSRNISFKVESINFIFETIVKELTAGNHDISSIFHKAGYSSGEKFGAIMNEKWELNKDDISLEDKISMWCQFDSDVGWGKLSNKIDIDYENFDISGHIELNENFQSYKRISKNLEDCELMKGYISGVLQHLLSGLETVIECDMSRCPRENPFHKKCIFNIFKVNS